MKTKLIKKYRDDGSLKNEYEVLETDESIKHGVYKYYWTDGKIIYIETTYVNNKEHGERKYYNEDGLYYDSDWYFEGEKIGEKQEGQEKFKELNKPYVFLENCKKLGV